MSLQDVPALSNKGKLVQIVY